MYQDKSSGLPNVWLKSGYQTHETKWGNGVSIDDHDGLARLLILELCTSPHYLSGEAFRFLRRRLELSQEELGKELGCTNQTIAKWEKGDISPIPIAAARLIRLMVISKLFPDYNIKSSIVDYNKPTPEKIILEYSNTSGWHCYDRYHTKIVEVKRSKIADYVKTFFYEKSIQQVVMDVDALSAFDHQEQKMVRRDATKYSTARN